MKFLLIPFISILMMSCPSRETNKVNNDNPADQTNVFPDSSDQNPDVTIQGEWELMPVLPSDTAAGRLPKLNFDLNTNTFSGNSGCNQMRGKFFLQKDSLIFLKDIALTRMACPGYNEKVFLENLMKVNHYRIENGVLELISNTAVISKWKRPGTIKEKTV